MQDIKEWDIRIHPDVCMHKNNWVTEENDGGKSKTGGGGVILSTADGVEPLAFDHQLARKL